MRQAITTKYLGPTNYRSARVKATCQAGSLITTWNHALNVNDNHDIAVHNLANKLGWTGLWIGGALPKGDGNCYVLTEAPRSPGALPPGLVVTGDES